MTYCIDYHDGTYVLSSDSEDQVREAVVIGSPDVEIPDILESYLEYRFNRDKDFWSIPINTEGHSKRTKR